MMNSISNMVEKRNKAWQGAKAFLESKRDKDGLISEEDAKTYDEMEAKVKAYSMEIERLEQMEKWIRSFQNQHPRRLLQNL